MNFDDLLFNMTVLAVGRFLDLFSTWYCSPNFDIELNSWMKRVGWKKVILINILLVPVLSILVKERNITIAVASSLLALRNFQVGTMARAMGEQAYLATYRKFVRNSPWYIPLLPTVFEVIIYITIGTTIAKIIGKPATQNLGYVSMIGGAFMWLGFMLVGITIGNWLEKKVLKNK